MIDYSSITGIMFYFMPNPSKKDAHEHLNNVYSDMLSDPDDLYEDSNTKTQLKLQVIELIKNKIIASVTPIAAELADLYNIRAIMNASLFKIGASGRNAIRLVKSGSETMRKAAIQPNKGTIDVYIGLNHVHFNPNETLTYLNWDHFSTNSYGPTQIIAPLTALDIAAAVATTITTGNPNSATGIATSSTTTTNAIIFNISTLPADVSQKYQQKKNRLIT